MLPTAYARLVQFLCDHRFALTGADPCACLGVLEQVQAVVHQELRTAWEAVRLVHPLWCGIPHHAHDCDCDGMAGAR